MIYKTNDSTIIIQAEATHSIPTKVVFWSHDRGTAKLRFKLMKNQIPQSLPKGTNVPIRLTFKSQTAKDGYGKHDYLATIEDRVNGFVSIVLEDNILGYVGTVEGSIYIDFPNHQSLDTAGRFTFSIKRSPIDETIPELEDYYFNGFSQVIDKVEEIVSQTKLEIDQVANDITKKINDTNDSLGELNQEAKKLEEKINEAEQHFVTKASTEKGLLIYKNNFITTEDWNTIQTSGIYYCAGATGENMPISGTLYGYLVVIKSASVIVQIFVSNGNFYNRIMSGSPLTWFSWNKLSNDSTVVHVSGNERIDGFKDFQKTPTVKGKEVVVANELPYEVWLGSGAEQTDVRNGARLKFGPELMTVSRKNGLPMRSNPLNWNQDRWQATVTRDCKLFFDGQCRLQPNSSTGQYAYLVAYRGAGEGESQIGFFGGRGSSGNNNIGYKQSIPLSGVVTFKAGDHFALSLEIQNGNKMAFTQINHMHIMEII